MIKFSWSTYGKKGKYLSWNATWNGKHDDDWYHLKERLFDLSHPFSETLDYKDCEHSYAMTKMEEDNPKNLMKVGDVVADNPVTRAMCEMLSDPKKSFLEHGASGNSDEYWYYTNMLGCLSRLWD